jgi:hypothetical protein
MNHITPVSVITDANVPIGTVIDAGSIRKIEDIDQEGSVVFSAFF